MVAKVIENRGNNPAQKSKAWWVNGGQNPYGDPHPVKKTPIRDFLKRDFHLGEKKKDSRPLVSNAAWVNEKNWLETRGIPVTC